MSLDDGYSKALLHFNGDDESTTFTDENGRSWTAVGSAQIDTAIKKFGTGSELFNGTTDYIYAADSDDLYFDGDLTIDLWARFTAFPASGAQAFFFSQRYDGDNGNWFCIRNSGGDLTLEWFMWVGGAAQFNVVRAVTLSLDTWYHFTAIRYGEILRLFVDGARQGSDYAFPGSFSNLAAPALIGANNHTTPNGFFCGNIDEYRISKGIARWTGTSFTVPTEEYSSPYDITPGALEAVAGLSGTPTFAFPVGALEVTSEMSITDIYNGVLVEGATLTASSELSASLFIDLVIPDLQTSSGFSVSGALWFTEVIPGPLHATAGLDASVSVFGTTEEIITYECVLTGTPDLTIPISSFQGRFRSGDPSMLSVVVPGVDLAADITARSTGDLIIFMVKNCGAGTIREKICTVDLEDVRTDEGAGSQSITLTGHRTETFTPKTVALTGASYKSITNGINRYRCAPDLYLRPGDTAQIDGTSFQVDLITMSVGVGQETMEISEEL